jgi:glycosyltransferase involved in cell wall biosynthesis
MRLTFVTNLYPPYIVGGNEMLCDQVVTALRGRGHDVSVICGRGRRLPAGVHGVLEIDLDRKDETFLGGRRPSAWEAYKLHGFSPASYRATRATLARLGPDVVVVWNLDLASLAPLVAARHSGRPVVTHVCDKWLARGLARPERRPPATTWSERASRALLDASRPVLRRATRPRPVVAISRFIKDHYVAAGFPEDAVEVIRLGVPTRAFASPDRGARRPGDPLRLLFAGALWEGKGPQVAVRAVGRLVRSGVPVHLDVCGAGTPNFLTWLQGVVTEEAVQTHVTFHGFVSPDEVRRFCQSRHVLVFPSEWDEPFAAVPVEAMAAGMAVVATTAGGTPEAITNGETGLLVPSRDPEALAASIGRLAEDDALRLRLGSAAAARARAEFDFDDYVARLEARYRSALAATQEAVH